MRDNLLNIANRGRILTVVIGALLTTGCDDGPLFPDGWLFARDVNAPNIVRQDGAFVLNYAILSLATGVSSKDIRFNISYSQIDPTGVNFKGETCDSSSIVNGQNDCLRSFTRTEIVTQSMVQNGERREGSIRIGTPTPGRNCTAASQCSGSVTISFHNANTTPHQTITWAKTQDGNSDDLTVN
jgi:hypothetical protein